MLQPSKPSFIHSYSQQSVKTFCLRNMKVPRQTPSRKSALPLVRVRVWIRFRVRVSVERTFFLGETTSRLQKS